MQPSYTEEGHVRAHCPECNAVTSFEFRGGEVGTFLRTKSHGYESRMYAGYEYTLLRCAGCGRGGFVSAHCGNGPKRIDEFYPVSVVNAEVPTQVPEGIRNELREAERCVSFGAWRAASALLRSTLEKTLVKNGYTNDTLKQAGKSRNLKARIEMAGDDGVITSARRQRAQDDIRVLGNDVLHEDWREVTREEVLLSHTYVQRILEDFYDDRTAVEDVLTSKQRTWS